MQLNLTQRSALRIVRTFSVKKFRAEAFRAKILGAEILHAAMFASGAEILRKTRIAIVFAVLRDMFLSAA